MAEQTSAETGSAGEGATRGAAAIGPNRIHHTGFTVSSLDRSLDFYCRVLGCEVVARQDISGGYLAAIVGYPDADIRNAHIRLPGTDHVVELFEYVAPDTVFAFLADRTNSRCSSHRTPKRRPSPHRWRGSPTSSRRFAG